MKRSIFAAIVVSTFSASSVLAMSSTNYQINADSINSGGNLSSSSNYRNLDSIGEPFMGSMSSTNFAIGEGLAPMVSYGLTIALDSDIKNLGAITPGTPIVGTTTVSVATDSWGGYDLYISQDKDLMHADAASTIPAYACAIAAPCAWSGSGFGFTVQSGTNVEAKWTNFGGQYAAIPTSSTLFHTKAGYLSGVDSTVVQYKLNVSDTQKSGSYANAVTYYAVAKL